MEDTTVDDVAEERAIEEVMEELDLAHLGDAPVELDN
jgi:hypothetical protein